MKNSWVINPNSKSVILDDGSFNLSSIQKKMDGVNNEK